MWASLLSYSPTNFRYSMLPTTINSDHGSFSLATASEEVGGEDSVGIAIYIKAPKRLVDTKFQGMRFYTEVEGLLERTRRHLAETDEISIRQREEHFAMLRELFVKAGIGPIYAKEIPNEYCPRACCVTKPWALVTTSKGHFKIGWMKRVINIDWTDSTVKGSGEELFPDEDVTKSSKYEKERLIHAWGWDKAVEYLKRLHS